MPKSKAKSKLTARAASSAGLEVHPALGNPGPLMSYRQGSEAEFRLPDAYNKPTAAKVLRSDYLVTADASGSVVWGEHYRLGRSTTVITAGVTGGSNTFVPISQAVAFEAEARLARVIGHRISVTYVGVEQESSGYLSMSFKTNTSDITSVSLENLHQGSDRSVRATEGMVVYNDFTQECRWEAPTVTTFGYGTYPIVVFAASGLPPNKDVFRVRVTRFLEYLPVEGSLSENDLGHEPHDPAALSVHGELSGNSTSIHTHAEGSTFMTKVLAVANAAYHVAQPVLTDYVVPKARAFLASQAMSAFSSTLPMLAI